MWSDSYSPSIIREENFIEVQADDGDQITGVESLYGNLLVFKDNSIHRLTVQGDEYPISRIDEVTQEYGCIAPGTLINVNNTIYFLSWKGFCYYNNNVMENIDSNFYDELQYILQTVDKDYLRLAQCGYNPSTNEIYLNMPWIPTNGEFGANSEYGRDSYKDFHDNQWTNQYRLGHIFVIDLTKKYVTKYSNTQTTYAPFNPYVLS